MTRVTPADPGFSLLELMIVLVVFGIVLSFGIPSFAHYSQTQQLRGTSENLVQTVQLQRSRAMATGQSVVIKDRKSTRLNSSHRL